MNNSFSLTCSQCGGQIQLPKGRTRIKCPYCGTEQILTGEVARQAQMEGVHICPVCNKDDRLEKVSAIVARETPGYPSQLGQMLTLPVPKEQIIYPPTPPKRFRPAESKAINKEIHAVKDRSRLLVNLVLGGILFICLCNVAIWMTEMQFQKADYISVMLVVGIFAGVMILGNAALSAAKPKPKPDMWDVLLPSTILTLFSAFMFYVSALNGEFDFFLFVVALGVGFAGVRHFVVQFPKTREAEADENLLAVPSANDGRQPFQSEWEQYQIELQAYKRHKAALEEKAREHNLREQVWSELYYCSRDDIVILPAEGLYAPAQDMETFLNIQANRRNRE